MNHQDFLFKLYKRTTNCQLYYNNSDVLMFDPRYIFINVLFLHEGWDTKLIFWEFGVGESYLWDLILYQYKNSIDPLTFLCGFISIEICYILLQFSLFNYVVLSNSSIIVVYFLHNKSESSPIWVQIRVLSLKLSMLI